MVRWFRSRPSGRADGVEGGPVRDSGPPTSSNGASSMHLFWDGPPPLVEAWAVVEVVEPPRVDRLYFWALQVSFVAGSTTTGAAHVGLQLHPRHPGGGAVNWGGYRGDGAGVLDGSGSELPSALDNPHTRDYPWAPHRRYRYRVHRSDQRGWRATVTDLATGVETVVRDLWVDGDHLASPMVWTEAFAHCDDPPAAVRWSGLGGRTADGATVAVDRVRVNYQRHEAGGCTNTTCAGDGDGIVQRTGVPRRIPTGAVLPIGPG